MHHVQLPHEWEKVAEQATTFGNGLAVLPRADVKSWSVTRSGASFNTVARIVPLLQRFPHFRLLLGAHALRLDWDGAKKKVSSVTYFDRVTETEQRLNCAAVVLGAGALPSTKLLFDSACSDFPEGLGNTRGTTGTVFARSPYQLG